MYEWFDALPFGRNPLLTTWVAAAIAMGIAFVATSATLRVVSRLVAAHRAWSAFFAGVAAPAKLLASALAVSIVFNAAPDDLPLMAGVRHVCALVVIAGFTWAAIGALRGLGAAIVLGHPTDLADNLSARRVLTQTRVLTRTLTAIIAFIGLALALVTFPGVRQVGASLLASAGVAGLVAGFAARSVLGNMIAGLQIALTQPLRLDDVLVVDNEWGRVEEITSAYVVMALWDERRLVIPLQYLIEHPFQNWTRQSAQLMGSVVLWVDPSMAVAPLRAEAERVCRASPEWDRRVCALQVTDADQVAMQVRCLVSSADSGRNFDLRCKVREALLTFMQRNYPHALPRRRIEAIGRNAVVPPHWASADAADADNARPAARGAD